MRSESGFNGRIIGGRAERKYLSIIKMYRIDQKMEKIEGLEIPVLQDYDCGKFF